MKLPQNNTPIVPTTGLTGIVLMTLHLTSQIAGWWWPVLYILLILSAMGNETLKR
jgi:hypothetical protein